MHIDKIKSNNKLNNLRIEKISKSHIINFKKGLLPHLKINNNKRIDDYLKLTNKTCVKCNKNKSINHFEIKRNKCKTCRSIEKKQTYKLKQTK